MTYFERRWNEFMNPHGMVWYGMVDGDSFIEFPLEPQKGLEGETAQQFRHICVIRIQFKFTMLVSKRQEHQSAPQCS